MPHRARRNCAKHGCRRLTAGRFCEQHERDDDRRIKASQPWRQIYAGETYGKRRRLILERDPICRCSASCCPEGCGRPSEVVDHVSPIKIELKAGRDPDRFDNLQGLAKRCHDRKTARENRLGRG